MSIFKLKDIEEFKIFKAEVEAKIITWLKRIFIIMFNIYSWYWLYKLIWIEQLPFFEGGNWERYYWWFLVTGSQFFFYKANEKEVLIK